MSAQTDNPSDHEKIDPKTMEMLVCPLTKARLKLDREKCELISFGARLAYPIRKGIPLLFVGEARQLTQEELDAEKHPTPIEAD